MAKKEKNISAQNSEAVIDTSRMNKFGVKTESKRIKKRETLIKILSTILIILLLLLSITFAWVSFVNKAGDFTVTMDPNGFNIGLELSETNDFIRPTRFLAGNKVEDLKDCTYTWLPQDIDKYDGSHNRSNGKEFLAYSFYLKNVSKEAVGYKARINIDSVGKHADEAMRVMVIKNGKKTIYAKPKAGTTNVFENNENYYNIDKLFVNSETVMETDTEKFEAGAVDKYTIVIWLEGWDPECVNKIMGGEIKLSMNFSGYELEKTVTG